MSKTIHLIRGGRRAIWQGRPVEIETVETDWPEKSGVSGQNLLNMIWSEDRETVERWAREARKEARDARKKRKNG